MLFGCCSLTIVSVEEGIDWRRPICVVVLSHDVGMGVLFLVVGWFGFL
jgi:hypothetical protein